MSGLGCRVVRLSLSNMYLLAEASTGMGFQVLGCSVCCASTRKSGAFGVSPYTGHGA